MSSPNQRPISYASVKLRGRPSAYQRSSVWSHQGNDSIAGSQSTDDAIAALIYELRRRGIENLIYDEFQAFDVQLSLNTGVGYKLVETETLSLLGRLGAGATRAEQCRNVGQQAEDENTLDQHGAKAHVGQRMGRHAGKEKCLPGGLMLGT